MAFILNAYAKFGVRDVRVGLFTEDYVSLKDRQLSKIATEFPSWLGEMREDRALGLIFKLKDCYGGGFIALRNLDDPSRYDSTEFAAIGIDELTKDKMSVFDQLRKRLRWPIDLDKPHFPCGGKLNLGTDEAPEWRHCPVLSHHDQPAFVHPLAGATNPGGPGHGWVKKIFVDRDFPPELRDYAEQFAFVKALAKDNRYNPPDYYKDLKSLPPKMAKAYADGDWNIFEGQFFDEWREDYHVCEPFDIPAFWTKIWAGDWGFFPDYFCGLWAAMSPDGDIWIYREVYDRRITASQWARILGEKTGNEVLQYRKLDATAWTTSSKNKEGTSIGDEFIAAGWDVSPANNDRHNGWARIREFLAWLEDSQGNLIIKPRVHVFKNCKNLIRTMPILIHDENNVEDVQKQGLEDHAPSALRYLLMSCPKPSIQPLSEMSSDWADASFRLSERKGTLESPFKGYQHAE